MNKAKGIAIIAALVLLLVVIAGTAFKTGAVGSGSEAKGPSDEEVGTLLADEINTELNGTGQVTAVGCQVIDKTTDKKAGMIAGNYFCVLGIKTVQGDACYAVTFPLVDNALPPADKFVGSQVDLSNCQ